MAALVSNLSVFAVAVFKLVPSANRINGRSNGVPFQLPSVDTIYRDLHEFSGCRENQTYNRWRGIKK